MSRCAFSNKELPVALLQGGQHERVGRLPVRATVFRASDSSNIPLRDS
jgi:hypothetical protein